MPEKTKAIFNWSSGKDSAMALYKVLQQNEHEVSCLLTSINSAFNRVSMHGVHQDLVELQAKSIGIPLKKILLPEMPSMSVYEKIMTETMTELKEEGNETSIFGDIFLEDLRAYREEKLESNGFNAIFPLWNVPTDTLIQDFLTMGFKAIVVCVNEKYLDKSFAGRIIDESFIADLPDNVDPCGENGEFHTFVFDGPIFKTPIPFKKGEVVYKKYEQAKDKNDNCYQEAQDTKPFQYGFWFCDLLLNE
ncbi:diphthine--ammonia ligase [Zhouia amylolytica]|uniref:Dph6-related ATP pyrophosphatase n=1 Tax=Zhouia amylolytica TaxID=376730 RepID=UPI0020CEE905|nr:diphthine--ammonia ligase [Zhouia amylolytica]MCQ0111914.1 diphthine--ammonia ligase [Zhouia amylolytica]